VPGSGHDRRGQVAGGGDTGTGGHRRCGGRPCCYGLSGGDLCPGGHCGRGESHSSHPGGRGPTDPSGEGGLREGVESGGGECHYAGLCSRGGQGIHSEGGPS
jgi:hypothetical protein